MKQWNLVMDRMIKLVVTDIDDTLLPRDRVISKNVIEVVEKLKKQNVKFSFATGRPPISIRKYAEQISVTAPIICCNGACLVENGSMKIIRGEAFALHPLMDLLVNAKQLGMTVLVFDGSVEYTLAKTLWTESRRKNGRDIPVRDILEFNEDVIYKATVIGNNMSMELNVLRPIIKNVKDNYSFFIYENNGFEIVAKGVDKSFGLKNLCTMLNIRMEHVLAIGDNKNDVAMIKAAKIGTAVGNAEESVKRFADYVASQKYSEGVIEVINKFIL